MKKLELILYKIKNFLKKNNDLAMFGALFYSFFFKLTSTLYKVKNFLKKNNDLAMFCALFYSFFLTFFTLFLLYKIHLDNIEYMNLLNQHEILVQQMNEILHTFNLVNEKLQHLTILQKNQILVPGKRIVDNFYVSIALDITLFALGFMVGVIMLNAYINQFPNSPPINFPTAFVGHYTEGFLIKDQEYGYEYIIIFLEENVIDIYVHMIPEGMGLRNAVQFFRMYPFLKPYVLATIDLYVQKNVYTAYVNTLSEWEPGVFDID